MPGELDCDVAPPDDRDAPRQLGQVEGVVRADRVLDAGDVGQVGACAGRDHQVLGRIARVADPHLVCRPEDASPLDVADAGIREQPVVDALQPRQLVRLGGDEPRPVEARVRYRPAVARGVLEVIAEVGGVDVELLGNAAAVHAGAADRPLLADRHARPVGGRETAPGQASGAGADHEQIEVVHVGLPARRRLRPPSHDAPGGPKPQEDVDGSRPPAPPRGAPALAGVVPADPRKDLGRDRAAEPAFELLGGCRAREQVALHLAAAEPL